MLTIALTQMWESFSFFGMRALLVLYLVSGAGYSATDAVILYTLYITSVKVFAGGGGYIVDRFLGYKQAVILGGGLITSGHLLLTFSNFFFLSLGCIVAGSAIFRVSLQALLGTLYEKDDPSRDRGFTLFYVGMNLGGLLAAVLCGFVAQVYGWHAGFGLAAFGMIAGMIFFLSRSKQFFEEKKTSPVISLPLGFLGAAGVAGLLSCFAAVYAWALPLGIMGLIGIFGKLGKKAIISVGVAMLLLIAFSAAEELWGSLLMLFSETYVNRGVFGMEIPSAVIAATNPLTIILFGPLLARKELRYGMKIALGFLALAAAFFILYATSLIAHPSVLYLIVGLALIAIGEVLLVPTILSFASKVAPPGQTGTMMGATIIALSMGGLLSGKIATLSYSPSVIFIGIASVAGAIALVTMLNRKGYLLKE